MRQTKTILTSVLLIAISLAPIGAHGATNDESMPESNPGVVESEIARVLGIEPTAAGLKFLDNLVGQSTDAIGAPSQAVEIATEALARLTAAETPLETFVAAAHATGIDMEPSVVQSQPLTLEIVEFYAHSGRSIDVASLLDLHRDVQAADPAVVSGLSILLPAMNNAAEAQASGDHVAMVRATGNLLASIEEAEMHFALATSDGCDPLFTDDAALGFIEVANDCPDTHVEHRALLIDLGGNDRYENNAGGASFSLGGDYFSPFVDTPGFNGIGGRLLDAALPINGSFTNDLIGGGDPVEALQKGIDDNDGGINLLLNSTNECAANCSVDPGLDVTAVRGDFPVAIALDLGGDDTYVSAKRVVQGAGNMAIGVLIDLGGTDSYTATNSISQGAGNFGVGVLIDSDGDDTYNGDINAQGALDGGYLLDLGGTDSYTAGPGSQGGRTVPFPAGLSQSILYDRNGNDDYTVNGHGQGAANLLIDGEGDDIYSATGGAFSILTGSAQGTSFGTTAGLLLDGAGNDQYIADTPFSQGYAVGGTSPAMLIDLSGNDAYTSTGEAQAVCGIPNPLGALLYDGSGDDTYTAASGQGVSRGPCGAFLVDRDGDDVYNVSAGPSQGSAQTSGGALGAGLGALLDGGSGNDLYFGGSLSQGTATGRGVGLLLDVDGHDKYQADDYSQGFANGGEGLGVGSVTARNETFSTPETYTPGAGLLVDGVEDLLYTNTPYTADSSGVFVSGVLASPATSGGRDTYRAGAYSQGVALSHGVGALLDRDGDDKYTADVATSRGYGETSSKGPALGLFTDADGRDNYVGQSNAFYNDRCAEKGSGGLFVDVSSGNMPQGCLDAAAAVATDIANDFVLGLLPELVDYATGTGEALVRVIEGVITQVEETAFPVSNPSPCLATDYFCDDVEADLAWAVSNDLNEWRRENNADPHAGPGSYSGDRYWYVGAPGVAHVSYLNSGPASITSPVFDLSLATAPDVEFRVSGSSESGFDFLTVSITDGVNTAVLAQFSGSVGYSTLQSYPVPAAFVGSSSVQLELVFAPDFTLEDGTGFSADDIRVWE